MILSILSLLLSNSTLICRIISSYIDMIAWSSYFRTTILSAVSYVLFPSLRVILVSTPIIFNPYYLFSRLKFIQPFYPISILAPLQFSHAHHLGSPCFLMSLFLHFLCFLIPLDLPSWVPLPVNLPSVSTPFIYLNNQFFPYKVV